MFAKTIVGDACCQPPVLVLWLLLLGLVANAAQAGQPAAKVAAPVKTCQTPKTVLAELQVALETGAPADRCAWRKHLDWGFRSWRAGSENLPLLATAVELVSAKGRQRTRALRWWQTFLAAQLDGKGSHLPPNLRFFKGSETMSNIYDSSVVTVIVAVDGWLRRSDLKGSAALAAQTRRYLRATWMLYALAAGRESVATGFRNDRRHPLPDLQRRGGQWNYLGPFVALAAARSDALHFGWDPRGPLLSRALEVPYAGPGIDGPPEEPEVAQLLTFAERHHEPAPANAYGLAADERRALRTLIEQGTLPSFLDDTLGGIATLVPFHFLAWPGIRVTVMERNFNRNTQAVFAVGYFLEPHWTDEGREAIFLYPWNDSRANLTAGWARLDLKAAEVRANNAPGSSSHPRRTVGFDLPSSPPQYHVMVDSKRRRQVLVVTGGASP